MRDEVIAGRSATIAVQLYDEESRVASSTPVTVEVERADRTVAVAPGTATASPAGSVGRYELALTPAQLPDVDIITATWSVTLDGQAQTRQTTIEVSGGRYFELAELRALPGLGDVSRFPTTRLAEERMKAQDEIEREVGVAFVERYGERSLHLVCGTATLRLQPFLRRVLGGSVGGVALTPEQIAAMVAYEDGRLTSTSTFYGDVVLRFTHAYTTVPPAEMHDVALELARLRLLGWRGSLSDQPVEADDLGQQTPFGEASDRSMNQDRILEVLQEWRRTEIGPVFA